MKENRSTLEPVASVWRMEIPRRPRDVARRRHNAMVKAAIRLVMSRHASAAKVKIGGTAVQKSIAVKIKGPVDVDAASLGAALRNEYQQQVAEFRGRRKRVRVT